MKASEPLPSKDTPADSVASPVTRGKGSATGPTILLVEDDEFIRSWLTLTLEASGYQILAAASGEDALATSDRHAGVIDLLVTDVILPRMSSVELVRDLARRRPELRLLFMSGYPNQRELREQMAGGASFLKKPFGRRDLLDKVGEALGCGRAS